MNGMAFPATTAATPWPATTVGSVMRAKTITVKAVLHTAGSATTLIVLAAWKTVQSVVIRRVPRAWLIAQIVGIVCAPVA